MDGQLLLDTDIVIAYLEAEAPVVQRLAIVDHVHVSATTIGELYFGALRSRRTADNLARVEDLVARTNILTCDTETGRRYGRIKNRLLEKGRPLPENDMWIAAVALQHGLTLVTRDAHFAKWRACSASAGSGPAGIGYRMRSRTMSWAPRTRRIMVRG